MGDHHFGASAVFESQTLRGWGLVNIKKKTSPNYWGYDLQQILFQDLESNLQNSPKKDIKTDPPWHHGVIQKLAFSLKMTSPAPEG